MGKKYFVEIQNENNNGLEKVPLGFFSSDGKFHFYHHNCVGYVGSPLCAWDRYFREASTNITDEDNNPVQMWKFMEKIQMSGVSEDYLMSSSHK